MSDIVQGHVLLSNPGDFAGMNEAYARVFTPDPQRELSPSSESNSFLGAGEQVRYQRQLQPGTYVFHAATNSHALTAADYQIVQVTSNGRHETPEAERTIRLGDTGITLPKLTSGTHRYAITNTGTTPHEVFILGVRDPADLDRADEIGAWLEGGQVGPPPVPVHFPGSHQTIDPGVTVVLTLDLHRATTYAFVDFQTGAMTTGTTR